MKTASDWALELFAPLRKTEPVAWQRCDKLNAKVIAQIQQDCLREAAEIANSRISDSPYIADQFANRRITEIRDAILAKAKELER